MVNLDFGNPSVEIFPLGESGLVVRFGETINMTVHHRICGLATHLTEFPLQGVIEFVPAYTTLTIYYDLWKTSFDELAEALKSLPLNLPEVQEADRPLIELPVCYGGEFGPDLEFVARQHSLTTDDVIDLHSSVNYRVYLIGFAPGFPYLGGMSTRLATPRRESPRLSIPAGSVGIAGEQTGVYPIETPGGWQLIGCTPWKLFLPEQTPPIRFTVGDQVRFRPITQETFIQLRNDSR